MSFKVYVIPSRAQRDFADTQAAVADGPARVTTLPPVKDEAELIEAMPTPSSSPLRPSPAA